MIIPLLLATALAAAAQDGPHAISRMEAILTAFGEPKPLRLQGFWEQHSLGGKRWNVKLSGPNQTTYEGWLGGPGGELTIWRGLEQDSFGMGIKHRIVDAREERIVRGWLSKLGATQPMRLASLNASKEKGIAYAYMAILRNGYPFVSYPQYGYGVTYTIPGHRFLSLSAQENPPAVDGIPPKLDEKAALAALQRIWDTEFAGPEIRDHRRKRSWYELTGKPELGYYVQKDRSMAGLVWRISYMSYRDVTYAIQGGSGGMLIDAITGRRIPTDAVP